jgi:hypothetical protein
MIVLRDSILLREGEEAKMPVIKEILPNNSYRAPDEDLVGTVLDQGATDLGGAIQLPTNCAVFNPDDARALGFSGDPTGAYTLGWMMSVLGPEGDELRRRALTCTSSRRWIYFPASANIRYELENGMKVLTDLQRAGDWLVRVGLTWQRMNARRARPCSAALQRAFARYLGEVKRELCYKNGFLDKNVGCVKEITGRAVAVNNWRLPLDTVGIPAKIVDGWMSNGTFLDLYELRGLSREEAYERLEKFHRVLVGRQPTHRKTNLFSTRIRIIR